MDVCVAFKNFLLGPIKVAEAAFWSILLKALVGSNAENRGDICYFVFAAKSKR